MIYTSTAKKYEVPEEKREMVATIRESICECANTTNNFLRNIYFQHPQELLDNLEEHWKVLQGSYDSVLSEVDIKSLYFFTYKSFLKTLEKHSLRLPDNIRLGSKVLTFLHTRDELLSLVVDIPAEALNGESPVYSLQLTTGEELDIPIPKADELRSRTTGHQSMLVEFDESGEYMYCMSACTVDMCIERGWSNNKRGQCMEGKLFTYFDDDCFSRFREPSQQWKKKSYYLSDLVTLTERERAYLDACAIRCNNLRTEMLERIERHRQKTGRTKSSVTLYGELKKTTSFKALPYGIANTLMRGVDNEFAAFFTMKRLGKKAVPPRPLAKGTKHEVPIWLKETKKPRTSMLVPRIAGDKRAPRIEIPIPLDEDGYAPVKAIFVPLEEGGYNLELLLKEVD